MYKLYYVVRRDGVDLFQEKYLPTARKLARAEGRRGRCSLYEVHDHGSWMESRWIASYGKDKTA